MELDSWVWSGKRKSKRGLPKPLSSQDDCSRPKGETHEELHLQYSTKIIHPVTEQIRKITIAAYTAVVKIKVTRANDLAQCLGYFKYLINMH